MTYSKLLQHTPMKARNNKMSLILFLLLLSIKTYCSFPEESFNTPTKKSPISYCPYQSINNSPPKEQTIRHNFSPDQDNDIDKKIDNWLQADIRKKYENLERRCEQNSHDDQICDIKDLDDACENYIWDQKLRRLTNPQINQIVLPNSIINTKDNLTMLHMLSAYGSVHTILLLLQNEDIDINVHTNEGRSPLDYAGCKACDINNHKKDLTVRALLQQEEPLLPSAQTPRLIKSSFFYAVQEQNEEVINMIIDSEFEPSAKNTSERKNKKTLNSVNKFKKIPRSTIELKNTPIASHKLGCNNHRPHHNTIAEEVCHNTTRQSLNNQKKLQVHKEKLIKEVEIIARALKEVEMISRSKK